MNRAILLAIALVCAWSSSSYAQDEMALGVNAPEPVSDHGALTGLSDDDHPQYVLVDGTRSMTGTLTINSSVSTDVVISESGLSRSSGSNVTFDITNPGAGSISLLVDGATVWTIANDGAASGLDADLLDGLSSAAFALSTQQVIAGAGLTGGGTLASDRTINVIANADGSIVANANDIQVGVINATQHGNLAGGALHAVATTLAAGFTPPISGIATDCYVGSGAFVSCASAGGGGDVVGPASATNNAVVLYSGTTGKLVKNSVMIVNAGAVSGVTTFDASGALTAASANFGTGSGTLAAGVSTLSSVVTASLDRTGAIAIGGTNGTTLSLSRSGQNTAVLGTVTVASTADVTGALTAASANFGSGAGALAAGASMLGATTVTTFDASSTLKYGTNDAFSGAADGSIVLKAPSTGYALDFTPSDNAGTSVALRRPTATAVLSTGLGVIDFYNGATRVAQVGSSSGGATDSGTVDVYAKASGNSLVKVAGFASSGTGGTISLPNPGVIDAQVSTGGMNFGTVNAGAISIGRTGQTVTFPGKVTGPGNVTVNLDGGASAGIFVSISGTGYSYFGTAGGTNSLINGSVLGDTIVRSDNKSILFTVDTGTTFAMKIATGNLVSFAGSTLVTGFSRDTGATATCTSNGTPAVAGTLTLNPSTSLVYLTNADVDGCVVTLAESNAALGADVTIIVVSNAGGLVTFPDVANVNDGPTLCASTGVGLDGIYEARYADMADDLYVGISCSAN